MSTKTSTGQNPEGSNNRFVRQMIDSHSVLGLSFAALIYVVSLSGALTLFVPEISLWELPDTEASYETTPRAVAAAARNAEAELKEGSEILNVVAYGPDEFRPYLTVRLNQRAGRGEPLDSTDWIADPQTGELLDVADAPYAHLIEDLHTVLLLPNPWGRYLVGIIGVCMFTLILSGVFAHPTIVKDAFKLRLKRNARMAWTDMHNRLSVWGLPFHLVITFTGAFLGVAGITVVALAMLAYEGDQEAAIQVIQGPQPVLHAPLMSASPDYESMLTRSEAAGRQFSILVASNPRSSGHTTSVAYYEEGILSMRTSDIYRNSGEFLEKFGGSGSPAGARVFGMVQPLHYGTFGGYPIKILYFVLSLALTYITSSGMMIWLKRKKQQGQPKPRTEALWRGMTTGLSAALAVAALIIVAKLEVPLTALFLGIWTASLALIAFSRNPIRWVRYHYLGIAAVLAVVAALHFPSAVSAAAAAKPLLIGIDTALLATALAFVAAAFRTRPEIEASDAASSDVSGTPAGSRAAG